MLIERDGPVRVFSAAAGAALSGAGSTIVIGGEAGAGKTALINSLVRDSRGLRFLRGDSEALFTPRPFGPLRDMAAALDRRVSDLLDQLAPQDAIFRAVMTAIQDSPQPTVIIFEDVHWADDSTLDLIKYLGRRIGYLRAVLIVSVRSDELSADHPLTQVLGDLPAEFTHRIVLEPLSVEGIAALTGASGQEAAEIHRITAGNPFFATELVASQLLPFQRAPASVRDAVWARLQRLRPLERKLLEAISIEPAGSETWLAQTLLGQDPEEALDNCLERGLLVRDFEGAWCFRHEIARAATMERLRPAELRRLHERAFTTLSPRSGVALSRLVHHASNAGLAQTVLDLAPEAAREAMTLGAHREAARHLATALQYVQHAPPEFAAQLYEDWSTEAALSMRIDQEIVDAAERAASLWREAGRRDRYAGALRWLSRLNWLRGDSARAVNLIEEALEVTEGLEPWPGMALIYTTRAQYYMFNDRFAEARDWSRKAIAIAEQIGDTENRINALNYYGGSYLFAGQKEGEPHMQECLRLALEHGFHEMASRAYSNFIEYAVLAKKFVLAERLLGEALAYDSRYDQVGSQQILVGRLAQLRLEQGQLAEAEEVALRVVEQSSLSFVGKLPARMALARARMRLGRKDWQAEIDALLTDTIGVGEQQNIVPARLAMIEGAWLRGDMDEAREHLELFAGLHLEGLDSWDIGTFAVWWKRCAMTKAFPQGAFTLAPPRAAELRGDHDDAFERWQFLGLPYEAALVSMQTPAGLPRAIRILDGIGAVQAASVARRMAKELGLPGSVTKAARGPYAKSRKHPLGLTGRQADVFQLLAEGFTNQEIADQLECSPRTVENHVTAILAKMNSSSRMEVMLRLRNEPWLLS